MDDKALSTSLHTNFRKVCKVYHFINPIQGKPNNRISVVELIFWDFRWAVFIEMLWPFAQNDKLFENWKHVFILNFEQIKYI